MVENYRAKYHPWTKRTAVKSREQSGEATLQTVSNARNFAPRQALPRIDPRMRVEIYFPISDTADLLLTPFGQGTSAVYKLYTIYLF